jgi:hypothetical protein
MLFFEAAKIRPASRLFSGNHQNLTATRPQKASFPAHKQKRIIFAALKR